MRFYADLHVHSKHSVATSGNADLEGLARWARLKGVRVVGTGDFTHPAWFAEVEENLEPAEPGLFRLGPELDAEVEKRVPAACRRPVRFALQVEISTIYKRGDRTRKVHHLVYAGSMETAARFREALDDVGNIESDGRPILGLDSRHLLEIVLESGPDAFLVPAHVWTPWFAVLGSRSGFDSVEACYGDLTEHIHAVETGLSSDPPMNWRVSDLDRFRLVSNSDAHSPRKLAREACVLDTDLEYGALRRAMEEGEGLEGTVEFFPQEGKYHLDGHRKCGVRLEPGETRARDGTCPACGDPVTVGVMHRVEELADRPEGARPEGREPFHSLVPLPEIVAEVRDVGVETETVRREVTGLLGRLGPELAVLADLPLEEVEAAADPLVAEAVRRLRAGDVRKEPGYDGEFGTIRLFDPDELERQPSLGGVLEGGGAGAAPDAGPARERAGSEAAAGREADGPAAGPRSGGDGAGSAAAVAEDGGAAAVATAGDGPDDRAAAAGRPTRPTEAERAGRSGDDRILGALDPDQRTAAEIVDGPLLVVAGPGAGKTRTLTHRIAHLVERGEEAPEACLTLTFTRRAAAEMRERMETLVPDAAPRVPITTFHGLGHALLREWGAEAGYGDGVRVVDDREARALAAEVFGVGRREAGRLLRRLSRRRRHRAAPDRSVVGRGSGREPGSAGDVGAGGDVGEAGGGDADRLAAWEEALRERGLVDFDGLLDVPLRLLEERPDLLRACRERWPRVSVDEYQDIDALQYGLIRRLAPEGSDLCAIGDPDQSIYAFRGARVGFFLRFRRDWPDARVVRLERNYRSSPAIVEAARQAIRPSSLAGHRPLRAVSGEGPPAVVLQQAPTAAAEAEFVVHTVERLMGGTSYFSLDSGRVDGAEAVAPDLSFSDFAVLYRTREQEGPLVEALDRSGIPYRRRSHRPLRDRPGVRAVTGALRELLDAGEVEAAAPAASPEVGPDDPDAGPGPDGGGGAAPAWLDRALDRARRRGGGGDAAGGEGPSPGEGVDAAGDAAGDELAQARELLEPLAERHAGDPRGFLDELAMGAEIDAWDPRADRVSLLTLHAAKGLEFPVVFIVGCEDGLLPMRWGGDDEVHREEERRLLFVGMTRAGSRLFLSHAERRPWRGGERRPDPSPFLEDVEERLLDRRRGFGGRGGRDAAARDAEGTAAPADEQLSLM